MAVTGAETVPPRWHSALLDGVPHGFFGRRGGVSTGAVASLNCGTGAEDDPAAVAENRARAASAILPCAGFSSGLSRPNTGATLLGVYQVHGRDCAIVRAAWPHEERPQADALASDRPGILLSILTADCAPVLLADKDAGVVGAAHAGWKGAFAGVTDTTVAAMERLGARRERIVAAIGPCIARASYEVDAPLRDTLCNADPANDRFFADGVRQDRWQFDLEAYVAARLAAAGIARVDMPGLDTYANEGDFFSFRRATHCGEPTYGRQISVIGIEGTE